MQPEFEIEAVLNGEVNTLKLSRWSQKIEGASFLEQNEVSKQIECKYLEKFQGNWKRIIVEVLGLTNKIFEIKTVLCLQSWSRRNISNSVYSPFPADTCWINRMKIYIKWELHVTKQLLIEPRHLPTRSARCFPSFI